MSSICCGASKIGAVRSINQNDILIHHVPMLYCPVCEKEEIHPKVKQNFDFIIDVAIDDGLKELDLKHYINLMNVDDLFEECSTVDKGDWEEVLRSQIDISLDLLSVARQLQDQPWEETLKKRLSILSNPKDVTKNR